MNNMIHIEQKDGELYADSRMVADVLGIERKSMNQLIHDREATLGTIRFENASSTMPDGRINPKPEKYALLTERQCLLLITMVRNSTEALEAKTALVDAFIAMRDSLAKKPQSMLDILAQSVSVLQEQQKQLEAQEKRLTAVEARLTTHNNDFFAIAGYASLRGVILDINKYPQLGKKATRLSKEHEYPVGTVHDPRYGKVNTYHVDILKEVFASIN